MNVVPIRAGTKQPAVKAWKQWTHRAQRWEELAGVEWCGGIAAINGPDGWHSLDLDGVVGEQTFLFLLSLLGLPEDYPWVVRTSHGYHLWFCSIDPPDLLPAGKGCTIGLPRKGTPFKQLELRWSDCYTILPPSTHPSGSTYRWCEQEPEGWFDLAMLDGEQLDRALQAVASFNAIQPLPPLPVPTTTRDITYWAQRVFEGVVDSLKQAEVGNRNHKLNWAAFRLGQLVGSNSLSESRVTSALIATAHMIGLAPHETARTIRSGMEKGKQSPRYPG